MMMPDIGDIIELIKDVPEKSLRAGMRGAVVHRHSDDVYEVEFTDDNGETLDFLALPTTYFIVVWRAETHQWIPIAEQTSALVATLPDDAAKEVLDFARFLAVRLEPGKAYQLPTPYKVYGATEVLAEAMAPYQEEES